MGNVISFQTEKKWMGRSSEDELIEDIRSAEKNSTLVASRDHNPGNMFGGESEMWLEENNGRYPQAGRYLVVFSCPKSNGKPSYFGVDKATLGIIHVSRL